MAWYNDPGDAFNAAANVGTFGAYGAYRDSRSDHGLGRAIEQSGREYGALGGEMRDYWGSGADRADRYFGGAEGAIGAGADYFRTPGYSEQLFNQRMSGGDPATKFFMDQGSQNLNNQFAARGGFNS